MMVSDNANVIDNSNNNNEDDRIEELLLRHSSPMGPDRRQPNQPSPLTVRNSSPSPLGLSRPRSNPRNRTPMRFESPLHSNTFRIPEEPADTNTNEGRRITILPSAGRAVGANNFASIRNQRIHSTTTTSTTTKSRKQGPSHRKVRRWNNDNFINLAQEVGGSSSAAKALLNGHANASDYVSLLPTENDRNNVMAKLARGDGNENLQYIRDKFFQGELYSKQQPLAPCRRKQKKGPLTPEQMMNRIDKRLQSVVVRAIENSVPATRVMEKFEAFLLGNDPHSTDEGGDEYWKDILLEPPTIVQRDEEGSIMVIRFLFDRESSTGGFHRLLLHSLVQFHGLAATSSTTPRGRLLTATGSVAATKYRLVDHIMQRKEDRNITNNSIETETKRMAALKVK